MFSSPIWVQKALIFVCLFDLKLIPVKTVPLGQSIFPELSGELSAIDPGAKVVVVVVGGGVVVGILESTKQFQI